MPRSKKGLGRCHKSGTRNNQGRRWTTPRDNRGFNCNKCHSKSNELSLPVIYVSFPLNNSVINIPRLSSFCQWSSRYSQNTPHDNRCFNSKDSNSKSNYFCHRWYLCLIHLIILSLIHLSYPLFVNSHLDLHITQRMSCKLLQYLVGLHLIRKIPFHRRPPRIEVAIFMDAWLIFLSWYRNNKNIMP